MKILHLSSAITWRGGEQQIAYLQQELQAKGIQQWIACPEGSELLSYCKDKNIPFLAYQKRFSVNPIPAFQIARFCKQQDIDLVHMHDSHAHTFGVLSATLFANKRPMVLSRRVDFPVGKSVLSKWKYNHPSIKKILCVSDMIRQITEVDIKDKTKLKTVHSGVDLSKFKYKALGVLRAEFQIPEEMPIIANVAAIAPHKDYFTFVKTVKILVDKGLQARFLAIGGEGGEQEQIQDYIKELGLASHIQLIGFRKDIPRILPEVDLLLFTSKTEGLGTSLLDAIACKVPIVATNAGGIPEIVVHEKTGLLAPVGDAESLAQQVQRMLENSVLRKQMIENATQKVQGFSKAVTAKKTLETYKDILKT